MADESVVEAIKTLRRDMEQLQRQLAATRVWCVGLEEEQTRLSELVRAAAGPRVELDVAVILDLLADQFAIHRGQDPAVALAQPRVGPGRLDNANGWRIGGLGRPVPQQARE